MGEYVLCLLVALFSLLVLSWYCFCVSCVCVYKLLLMFIHNPTIPVLSSSSLTQHIHTTQTHILGWWYMQDGQGRCGWIPASYLESVDESKVENSSEIEGTKYEACKAHRAHQPDELDLNRGDEVLVIRASRNGWWTVK